MSLFGTALADIQPDAVAKAVIPFGEWLPDQAAVNNPGALEALNVVPADDGTYAPLPTPVAQTNGASPEAVRGAVSVLIAPTNVTQLYTGGANGIYTRLAGTPFANIYSMAVDQNYNWQFIQFKTLMVALHQSAFPVKTTIGTTTAPVTLGGNPPRAGCGAMVGDFLVLGNLYDDPDAAHSAAPNRIRWSGIKNIDANWVTDPVTQADYNDMPPEGGSVVAIAGRTNMLIFQERKISFGRYVNLPSVWDIETVEHDVGCIARDSVVSVGTYKYFIAHDGFRVWNGTNTERIGDGKVDKYFFNRLQYSRRERINGAFNPNDSCIYWGFPTGADGTINEIIIYNTRTGRFAHALQALEYLLASYASTVTTDDFTVGYTDSDLRYVDDPGFLSGGQPLLAMFSTGHLYSLFLGGNMAATIDTAEFSGPDSRRVFANSARPIVDATSAVITVQPIGRDELLGGDLLYGTAVTQEIDGNCPIIAEARYLRFRTQIPANLTWRHATGIEIARKAGGQF